MAIGSDESALIAAAVSGNQAATTKLLLAANDRLAAWIRARSAPAGGSADDLLQEVFAAAFRDITRFRGHTAAEFHAWLAAIARHRILDLAKAARARKRHDPLKPNEVRSLVVLLSVASPDRTPSRSVARREASAEVMAALERLRPEYRQALQLRYIEDLPVAQCAARMGRTARAVHMLCNRGLRQMRQILGDPARLLSRKG